MGKTAGHDPGTAFDYVEKLAITFPPVPALLLQLTQPFATVFGIAIDEFKSSFLLRKRRSIYVYGKHGAKPEIFADTLVHHLLANAAAARVARMGAEWQVDIVKFAPDANYFHSLCSISLHQKFIGHPVLPARAS